MECSIAQSHGNSTLSASRLVGFYSQKIFTSIIFRRQHRFKKCTFSNCSKALQGINSSVIIEDQFYGASFL